MVIQVGAARAVIPLDGVLPLNGFGIVHDPLYVRALVLDDGESRAVLVSIDLTSLGPELIAETKANSARIAGVTPDDVLVMASHTFSAPHVLPASAVASNEMARQAFLVEEIAWAVQRSASQAVAGLRPVSVRAGVSQTAVGVNRDVETPAGWWLGADPGGLTNPDLPVLVFEDETGQTVAVIASLAVQSSVTSGVTSPGGLSPVSSDLAGAAACRLERDGAVVIIATGAAGDQAPRGLSAESTDVRSLEQCFSELDVLGDELAADLDAARAAAQPITASPLLIRRSTITLDAQVMPSDIHSIEPSRHPVFTPDGTTSTSWVTLSLGQVVLVGVQPELSAASGIALRRASPFTHTLIMSLTDGAAKYMADTTAYDRITYEAMNSRFRRGAAERLVDAIVAGLRATPVIQANKPEGKLHA